MPSVTRNLVGKVFGRLTVISLAEPAQTTRGTKETVWNCKCSCGTEKPIRANNLLRGGGTRSCGCLNKDISSCKTDNKHAKHPLYPIWSGMMARCYNPKNKSYARYGQRGIIVCSEWHKIENFMVDMGHRPTNTSLERIDNNKGYYAENCRWATAQEQNKNKRNNDWLTVNGKRLIRSDADRLLGKAPGFLYTKAKRLKLSTQETLDKELKK